ncbi:MAG: GatB/YqeY domain-containing protein [Chloroflexi bacterium]|nr:GatB/YqeY domain-containing protein [Chloroflexota bacterium]
MSLKAQITDDLKAAMKNKDTQRRNTLRSLQSAIKQVEIDTQTELDDAGIIKVLKGEIKRRQESLDAYQEGGREDEVATLRQEIAIIEPYLPEQMSRGQIEQIVQKVIDEVGATSPKDMGKVMPEVMKKVQGQADGKLVNEVVRELLS